MIETVKGGGPASFPLAYSWGRADPPKYAYSDPRTASVDVEEELPSNYAGAAAWHRDPAFYDYARLHEDMDDTDSCGGALTAMLGGRYLAFRNAAGSVLALEPVAERDDPWFDRVRRFASDPEAFRPALELADFFEGSEGVALVRLKACSGRNTDASRAKVRVEWLRGQFQSGFIAGYTSIDRNGISSMHVPKADPDAFSWIADYLERIKAPCRKGMTLLLVTGPFDFAGLSLPRLARVEDGSFVRSDLLSGYRIEGPALVSIDQAFAWVEAGAKTRRETRRSITFPTGRAWFVPSRTE